MGSDATCRSRSRGPRYFNPRSPDGERPIGFKPLRPHSFISIHAPRMGSDSAEYPRFFITLGFQSTLPGWGATSTVCILSGYDLISIHAPRMGSDVPNALISVVEFVISIHAPRMGSDRRWLSRRATWRDFNPRSPDGERPTTSIGKSGARYFNPRSPDGERHIPL